MVKGEFKKNSMSLADFLELKPRKTDESITSCT